MAILYAVVARGTVVLTEFSAVSGNVGAISRRILEKLPPDSDTRLCLSQDRYIFHILIADGIAFVCMANDTFGRRVPFMYLEDIHMRFMKNYGRVAQSALAYAMNDEFSRVLHQQMEFFSSNPSADTLNRVRGEVSEIHTIMVENIEKVLDRGDRIALLVDKTSTMQDSSFHFRKQSRRLRHALWMKNAKLFLGLCSIRVANEKLLSTKEQLFDMTCMTLGAFEEEVFIWNVLSKAQHCSSTWNYRDFEERIVLTGAIVLLLYIIIAACCGGITLPSCRS